MGKTLFDKIWTPTAHQVEGGIDVLYIDRHFIHEVTSPQAFDGLRSGAFPVFEPKERSPLPTTTYLPVPAPAYPRTLPRFQVDKLTENCEAFGIRLYTGHLPGHRPRHRPGAGADPTGHDDRLRGQPHLHPRGVRMHCLWHRGPARWNRCSPPSACSRKPKRMRITVDGELQPGVLSKDIILYIISQLSASGGTLPFQ